MGIIIRQSVKSAIWSYLGIVIGYVNIGIIMPQFFNTAQIGLVTLFASVSLIFAQFGTLGFTSVINRLFPVFRNPPKHHNGFLFLAVVTGMIGFGLTVAVFILLKPLVISTNIQKSPLLVEYLWLLMPLVLMRIFFTLLDNYNKMLYDAVTGTFWMELMHKVINLLLIILFAFGWMNFRLFFAGYVLSMSLPVIPLVFVLIKRHNFNLQPRPEFIRPTLRKEVMNTMLFGFINGLASIILLNVDKVFVNQYLSLDEVGIFGVATLFASLIRVPYNSVSKIAIGIISEAWKRNDKNHIREIYQKASLNQAIIGFLIYTGILVNLRNIFAILPPVYASGKWVLIIYSAGILVNTVIGLAGNITEISKYFRFNTLFLGLSILIQFALSYLFIPMWGITGAALATVITLVSISLFQAALQRIAFGIVGVSRKLFIVALAGIAGYFTSLLLPRLPLAADIIVRSGIVTLVFTSIIFLMKISPEVNSLIEKSLKLISGYAGRK
jgi:O-antigen/teichoic acid export membrane protein